MHTYIITFVHPDFRDAFIRATLDDVRCQQLTIDAAPNMPVAIAHDVPDTLLAHLYRLADGAMFTVEPDDNQFQWVADQ